jgi:ABC-type sugar transport system ATPase subunit
MQQSEPYLSFRGIGKTFPGVNALTDISFDCYAGQVHALMGENGAGKSTLLKILSGNYAPTTGTLALKGEEVSFSDTTAALNAGVAIIYQELHLVPEMTVAENIYLGQLPHKGGFVNRSLGLGDIAAFPFAGEQAVLVHIYFSQDEALRLADRLVLMDNGRVVQQGTPLELLTQPATAFVREFFGRSELGVRLLSLRTVGESMRSEITPEAGEPLQESMSLRDALSAFVTCGCERLSVVNAQGQPCGTLHFRDLLNGEAAHEVDA